MKRQVLSDASTWICKLVAVKHDRPEISLNVGATTIITKDMINDDDAPSIEVRVAKQRENDKRAPLVELRLIGGSANSYLQHQGVDDTNLVKIPTSAWTMVRHHCVLTISRVAYRMVILPLHPIAERKPSAAQKLSIERRESSKRAKVERRAGSVSPYTAYINGIPMCSRERNAGCIDLRKSFTDDLCFALLTTYLVDTDWLVRTYPQLKNVPVKLSIQEPKRGEPRISAPANFQVSWPPFFRPFSCNHGKCFVLFYPEFLRVIISTANLIREDYEFKAEAIWQQDFPRMAERQSLPPREYSATYNDFKEKLVDYLVRLNLITSDALDEFDFSGAAVALITSVSGTHKNADMYKYGLQRMKRLLTVESKLEGGKKNLKDPLLMMQFSSLGALGKKWVDEEFIPSMTIGTGIQRVSTQIVWPSVDCVRQSVLGYAAGGSICATLKNSKQNDFVSRLHKYQGIPQRLNCTPHIKSYGLFGEDRDPAYLCFTSANLSKAAWGTFQLKQTQFFVMHFEIGFVLLPGLLSRVIGAPTKIVVPASTDPNAQAARYKDGVSTVPLPFVFPAVKYSGDDHPWEWDTDKYAPDIHGHRFIKPKQ